MEKKDSKREHDVNLIAKLINETIDHNQLLNSSTLKSPINSGFNFEIDQLYIKRVRKKQKS